MFNCLLKLRRDTFILILILIHLSGTICIEIRTFAQLWSFSAWFCVSFEPQSFLFSSRRSSSSQGIKLGVENKSSKRRQNCKRSEERWTLNDSCYLCNWLCNYLSGREAPSRWRWWLDPPCLQTRWSPSREVGGAECFFCLGSTLHWNLLRRLPTVRSPLSQANKLKK